MRRLRPPDQLGWQQSVTYTSLRLQVHRLTILSAGWPTFLANAAPPVKIELYNFAVGGAATNNTALYLAGQPHTIPDFPQQFDTFKQYFAQPGGIATSNGTVTWQSNRTLFTVFFGINDVGLEVRNGEDRRIELPQIFGELREIDAMLRQDRRSSWRSRPLFSGTWSNIFSQLYTLGGGRDFPLFFRNDRKPHCGSSKSPCFGYNSSQLPHPQYPAYPAHAIHLRITARRPCTVRVRLERVSPLDTSKTRCALVTRAERPVARIAARTRP